MISPIVSIIVPVFNSSEFIYRALDSIKKQTFTSYEVIVIDDGSTDDSVLKIKEHELDVKLIKKPNGGVSSARNLGIRAAKGKYIAFLDSDDEWISLKLSIQILHLEKNESLIALYCRDYSLRILTNTDAQPAPELIEKNSEQIFMHPYNLITSSFVIKTNVIKELGGFDESLKTAEDIDLYLKVSLIGKIGELSKSLCVKHAVACSLGSTSSSYEDNLYVISRFFKRNVNILPDSFEKKYIIMKVHILNSWCEDLLWKNNFSHSLDICFRSLKIKMGFRAIKLLFKIALKFLIVQLKY